uniref:G2/M-phase specific E3 ubiquitin protein ligase n=1 Tax=Gadus morhua TaxID=8049 RepID=A0A8C5F5G6_GADMO
MVCGSYCCSHYCCMCSCCCLACSDYSSGVYQRGEEDDGVFGFLVDDIIKETRRCSRLTCGVCKRKGAAVGCCVGSCKKKVHFPCGPNQFIFQFSGDFMSYCVEHGPKQSLGPGALEVSLPQSCSVCLDPLPPLLGYSVLKCPSCHTSWFHRACIQRQAISAGLHFFRCTLCNNKERFQEEMLTMGIYIPERDASWELESNAFEELLQVYENCDAPDCCCRQGRSHSAKTGWFEIVRCRLCGSRGTHRRCSGLDLDSSWACLDCTQTEDLRGTGQDRAVCVCVCVCSDVGVSRFKDGHETPFPSCPGGSEAATQWFLKQLVQQIQSCEVFEGPDGHKNLALDAEALRGGLYLAVGRLLSVCLVHGAPPLLFLGPALFQGLFGPPHDEPLGLHHMTPDTHFTRTLSTMATAQSLEDLKGVMAGSWEYLELAGCNRPISSLDERDALVDDLVSFTLVTRLELPLQRWSQVVFSVLWGLQVQLNPAVFYRTFCGPEEVLDAHTLSHLLTPKRLLTPPPTRLRREKGEEPAVLSYWRTFLQDCEEGRSSVSLQDVLRFTTGVEVVPAAGLLPSPSLSLGEEALFPRSDPSANLLLLPSTSSCYQAFKSSLEQAVSHHTHLLHT